MLIQIGFNAFAKSGCTTEFFRKADDVIARAKKLRVEQIGSKYGKYSFYQINSGKPVNINRTIKKLACQ